MKKDHKSVGWRRPSERAILARCVVLFFVLSFAGCTAAHGKRSYNGRNAQHRSIDSRRDEAGILAEVETDGNAPAPNKQNRWILSRLIRGRLTVPAPVLTAGERTSSNRWYGAEKVVALPENWNTNYDSTRNEIIREEKMENSDEGSNESKELDESFDLTRKNLEPRAESTDLLLVPPIRDYDNRPNHSRRLKLFKILADSSDDNLK